MGAKEAAAGGGDIKRGEGSGEYQNARGYDSWFSAFGPQTMLLLKKNFLLYRRSLFSTIMQMLFGIIACLLLLGLQVAVNGNQSNARKIADNTAQDPIEIGKLARCGALEGYNPKAPALTLSDTKGCSTLTFLTPGDGQWDNPDAKVYADAIIADVAKHHDMPPEINSPSGVYRLHYDATKPLAERYDAFNDFLYNNANWTRTVVILPKDFAAEQVSQYGGASKRNVKYEIQTNSTRLCKELNVFICDDEIVDRIAPTQFSMDKAILKVLGNGVYNKTFATGDDAGLSIKMVPFPHPDLKSRYFRNSAAQNAPTFFFGRLIANMVVNTVSIAITVGAGYLLGLEFFMENDFIVIFLFFLSFSLSLLGITFVFSTLVPTAELSTYLGFGVFIVFLFAGSAMPFLYASQDASIKPWQDGLAYVSPCLFYVGLGNILSASDSSSSAGNNGIRWACPRDASGAVLDLDCKDITDNQEFWTLEQIINHILLDALLYFIAAWYLDKTWPSEYGSSEALWFPFSPWWWFGITTDAKIADYKEGEETNDMNGVATEDDVLAERRAVLKMGSKVDSSDSMIHINRLAKSFGPRAKRFRAVKEVSYRVKQNSLFCLLGPNGAGKTTTINMLTGLHPQTAGHAFVDGLSVKSQMPAIRKKMGVCPQHDILWEDLTGRERIELFAGIKNVPDIQQEVADRLGAVDLREAGKYTSGAYSGGMQRRLSTTIALTGNPKIASLDEPTTGMAPISRRNVWEFIQAVKPNRTIVLTTHSMEEADILGDNIAIMGKGRLRAFGNALRLKRVFGAGYQITLTCPSDAQSTKAVMESVLAAAPQLELLDDKPGTLIFKQNTDEKELRDKLCEFLTALENDKASFGVSDFSIAMTTLEEVFLNLNKQDESGEMLEQLRGWQSEVAAMSSRKVTKKAAMKKREIIADLGKLADRLSEFLSVKELTRLSAATEKLRDDDNLEICLQEITGLLGGSTAEWEMIEFAVPEGSAPGSVVQINHGGNDHNITIPEGTKAGQMIRMQVPVKSSTADVKQP